MYGSSFQVRVFTITNETFHYIQTIFWQTINEIEDNY